MLRTVELPLWLLLLILLFAGVTFASHFLFPSVRWFFRKRAERVVARLNESLPRPIDPFKLTRRFDTVQRLTYDPEVLLAVAARAKETGLREDVVLEEARDYAREIVPAFSATLYFGLATRAARWLSRALYRVRLVHLDPRVQTLPAEATVIYVINHRSNMDYVLLTYLSSFNTALSYAMGEWARVWPLSPFLRMFGGYYIRRRSRNELYRRVLARYVQIAANEGLTQAIFPEGGLSLDGTPQSPKMGLLHYVLEAPTEREVIFVPVSLNYDRVLEDKVLIKAGQSGKRRFRVSMRRTMGNLWRLCRRRFHDKSYRFGHAAVVFGRPLKASEMLRDMPATAEGRTEWVAGILMQEIANGIPVLPVPLVAAVLQSGDMAEPALRDRVRALAHDLGEAHLYFPKTGIEAGTEEALAGLAVRKVIARENGQLTILEPEVIDFYAGSIAHLLDVKPENSAKT